MTYFDIEFGLSYGNEMFLSCSLENWYYRILIVMTGNLDNAKIAVDALSVWYEINSLLLKKFHVLCRKI